MEDVARAFGRVVALDGVTLRVAPGRLVAVTGPNGAGKTTLLRLAAGLDRPTRGRVRIGGADPSTHGPAARRGVAFVGQDPGLYDALTVRENLAFVGRFHGRSGADVARAADAFGLAARLEERAGAISRGERERAALARALLGGALLLLDEPTTALDEEGRARLVAALESARAAGRSALVATHDAELAKRCDEALRLQGGRLA
jgi:heme ABC exporter ATP-binding subunit CcmA